MRNLRLGLKTILCIALLFSVVQTDFVQARACRGFFLDSSQNLLAKRNLKVVNWNLLNFKINIEYLEKGVLPDGKSSSKSREEILEYKNIFEKINGDIYVFQEAIGGSLKYFAKHYLKDEYEVILENSKKDSEMQIAFLVRKNLEVDFEVESHEHVTWRNHLVSPPAVMPIFERDLPALYLRQKDDNNIRPSDDPQLIIFGTHFKSMKGSREDPKSTHQRTVQIQAAAQIIKNIDQRFNKGVPLMLTGDFNTDVVRSKETEPLRFFLKDSMRFLNSNLTLQDKFTHIYHPYRSREVKNQLDGQLVNEKLGQKLMESYVFRFEQKGVKPQNPSDHSPVIGIYDMTR